MTSCSHATLRGLAGFDIDDRVEQIRFTMLATEVLYHAGSVSKLDRSGVIMCNDKYATRHGEGREGTQGEELVEALLTAVGQAYSITWGLSTQHCDD
ncbi:hypothetical protein RRF57_005437 [Xylaria bambusicola]|uniref:Uncharacterized protein n=1 Tax=Xylaria bambusicola TaxID=326684 RepID=A0AAN7Z619_9PEZI